MGEYASICRQAALAQAILDAIDKHKVSDDEASNVLVNLYNSLVDGYSDWASELIYEAKELTKDGREI